MLITKSLLSKACSLAREVRHEIHIHNFRVYGMMSKVLVLIGMAFSGGALRTKSPVTWSDGSQRGLTPFVDGLAQRHLSDSLALRSWASDFNLSKPQLLHLQNGSNSSTYLVGVLQRFEMNSIRSPQHRGTW